MKKLNKHLRLNQSNKLGVLLMTVGLALLAGDAAAITLGGMASNITGTFTKVTLLVTAGSYIAGLAFSIGAIMKFKQHKDNPTQVPIGTPVSLIFIAAALLFLPSILSTTGNTMFGEGAGVVAGPSGQIFKSGTSS